MVTDTSPNNLGAEASLFRLWADTLCGALLWEDGKTGQLLPMHQLLGGETRDSSIFTHPHPPRKASHCQGTWGLSSPGLGQRLRSKCASLSHVPLSVTSGTLAGQTPLSRGFSRQEYWSGSPFPSPVDPSRPRDGTRISCTAGEFFAI